MARWVAHMTGFENILRIADAGLIPYPDARGISPMPLNTLITQGKLVPDLEAGLWVRPKPAKEDQNTSL